MKVRAKATFRTEVNGKLYQRGNEYEITDKMFDRWRTHFVSIESEKEKKDTKTK